MGENEVIFNTKIDIDTKKLQKEIDIIDKKLANLTKDRDINIEMHDNYGDRAMEARDKYNAALEKYKGMNVFNASKEDRAAQAELVKELKSNYTKLASKSDQYADRIAKKEAEIGIYEDQKTAKTEQLKSAFVGVTEKVDNANKKIRETATATKHATSGMDKFINRVKGLAKRVLIFSFITMALRSTRKWFGNIIKQNEQASAALNNLKGALLTLVQPLVNVILPVITKILNVLTTIITFIATGLSALFGTTLAKSAEDAQAMSGAMSDADSSAKSLKKTIAGFDELNIVNDESDGGSSAGASGANFGFASSITSELEQIAVLSMMGMIAIGIILLCTGHVGIGLAMIAIGALGLYGAIKYDKNGVLNLLRSPLLAAIGIIGGLVLAVLGIILICTGVAMPLGIGLLIVGLAGLVSAIVINWDGIKNFVIELVQPAIDWVVTTFKGLIEFFKGCGESIKYHLSNAWAGVKSTWQGAKSWFSSNVITPIVSAFSTAVSVISNAFSKMYSGIKNGIVSALNGVITAVEWAVNGVVSLINGFLSGVNWAVSKLGKVFGFNWSVGYINPVSFGRIPALAEGTVVPPNGRFLAMLGDNKKETEVVSPLSTMKEALKEALAEANFNGNINVYLDGKQISNSVTKYQLRANRAMGV